MVGAPRCENPTGMHAFVDESLRTSGDGLYLVAAVVVVDGDLGASRRAAQKVLLARQRRFHWRNESERQRWRMLEAISTLDVTLLAYSRVLRGERQERARALCIERMLWDLREMGVSEIVFESRDRGDNKDARTIANAQRAGVVAKTVRYRFERPEREPILWIPDAIAGAASAQVAGETPYLDQVPEVLVRLVVVDR